MKIPPQRVKAVRAGFLADCFTWPQDASNRHENRLSVRNLASGLGNRKARCAVGGCFRCKLRLRRAPSATAHRVRRTTYRALYLGADARPPPRPLPDGDG